MSQKNNAARVGTFGTGNLPAYGTQMDNNQQVGVFPGLMGMVQAAKYKGQGVIPTVPTNSKFAAWQPMPTAVSTPMSNLFNPNGAPMQMPQRVAPTQAPQSNVYGGGVPTNNIKFPWNNGNF